MNFLKAVQVDYLTTGCRGLKDTSELDLPEVFFNCFLFFWTIFGFFLDNFWILFWKFLNLSFLFFLKCLGSFGTILGVFSDMFRTRLENVGIFGGKCWEVLGTLLGRFWGKIGKCWPDLCWQLKHISVPKICFNWYMFEFSSPSTRVYEESAVPFTLSWSIHVCVRSPPCCADPSGPECSYVQWLGRLCPGSPSKDPNNKDWLKI